MRINEMLRVMIILQGKNVMLKKNADGSWRWGTVCSDHWGCSFGGTVCDYGHGIISSKRFRKMIRKINRWAWRKSVDFATSLLHDFSQGPDPVLSRFSFWSDDKISVQIVSEIANKKSLRLYLAKMPIAEMLLAKAA